jgi:ribosomal protein L37AE/L43A
MRFRLERTIVGKPVAVNVPEVCPHCGEPIESLRRTPEDGRPHEVWRCDDCGEEWRHPGETVLNGELDFSESGEQLSRREDDADLNW